MVEVLGTAEFEEWFLGLSGADARAVVRGVGLLEAKGLALGYPYSSALQGSRHAFRELRIQSGGRPLRILYAFDPKRQAVLILGGDKTGDNRFYLWAIPKAEAIWERYLRAPR
ncbi:MAG TPA: type II toxin-antitoxin system RelE/ParE family toxin [Thermoanaerobaculia bacterium]|nr:type II toxin-antitoxin system RelE/ParE family toxin [Thermoanaerobaculia bacterium]